MNYALLIFLILVYSSFSQFEDLSNENLFENTLVDTEDSEILDEIEYYRVYPIPLQKTNSIELSRLPLIDRELATKIIDLVQLQGIRNYNELFDSLSLSEVEKYILKNCTYYHQPTSPSSRYVDIRIRSNYQIEDVAGFEKGKFQGDKLDYYSRINANFDIISGGILLNKDAGEPNNFDFISGYLSANISNLNFIIGDYSIEFGLGNILWRNFGFRKGADAINPIRYKGKGILPYRSSIESNFFRGLAVSQLFVFDKNSDLKLNLFASRQYRHSTIDTVLNIVKSLKNDGLFRTDSEISRKNNLEENILGSIIEYRFRSLQISFAGFYYQYPYELSTQSSSNFTGKSGKNLSIFASYNIKNHFFRTEISQDASQCISAKLNYIVRDDYYDFTVGLRNFPELYRAQFGYIFGESSSPANEFGVYTGFIWKKFTNTKISFYADYYNTYGGTYYVPLNVSGVDLLGDYVRNFTDDWLINLRFRYEIKTEALNINNQKLVINSDRTSLRIELKAKIAEEMYCRMRLEIARRDYDSVKSEEWGSVIFGEYKTKILEKLNFGFRLSYYDTESYDSAIWQYEYTMPGYAFSYPLYGKGMRFYIYSDYKINEYLKFWLKYTLLFKNNVTAISSGYNEIQGFGSSRVTAQLDFYF